ncbi:MAG: HAD family hydrolase [Blautia sp.]|jgi:Cof subfamily protein (haloacid dehalogenase superfamily)
MSKKMIFFDVDGTITQDITFRIPDSTPVALQKAHENGHLLFVNTGRTFCAVDKAVRALPFDGFVTGCGTYIYYHGQQILANPLPGELCREIVQYLRQWKIPVFYEGNDDLYFDPENPTPQWKYDLYLKNYKKDSFTHIDLETSFVFDKFMLYPTDDSDMEAFLQYAEGKFTVIDRGSRMYEIIQAPFSKATGIQFLIDRLGIPLEDCYVIGDSTNDLPMLTYVPGSIAMGNSMKEILPYCSYQTTDIMDDGIYHALAHFGMID